MAPAWGWHAQAELCRHAYAGCAASPTLCMRTRVFRGQPKEFAFARSATAFARSAGLCTIRGRPEWLMFEDGTRVSKSADMFLPLPRLFSRSACARRYLTERRTSQEVQTRLCSCHYCTAFRTPCVRTPLSHCAPTWPWRGSGRNAVLLQG